MKPINTIRQALFPIFIPILFLIYHFKLLMGTQTLAADTGDGVGVFKFFSIPPLYWNWFEGGGQPYWTEQAVYRMQDPLMWPLILLSKGLPLNPLVQFNLYILLRISLLGLGTYFLLQTLKCRPYSRLFGTMIAMFGSAFSIMFRSIGALDLISSFIGIALFGSMFFESRKRSYALLLGLVLLHASITYHILYLVPVFLLWVALNLKTVKMSVSALLTFKRETVFLIIAVLAAFSAEYLAVKDPGLLPVLRTMRYGTWVDSSGRVVDKDFGVGESVLSTQNLRASAVDCGIRFSCRHYPLSQLKTFVLADSAWSLTGYVSFAGLGLLALSLFLLKKRVFLNLHLLGAFCFVLSLGIQTPLWGGVQKILPILEFVRHTGFYFHLWVYILCLMVALTLNEWEVRCSPMFLKILFVLVGLDLLAFQRLYVGGFLNFTKPGQLEKIATPPVENFISRRLRIYNPYLIPRSSVATTYQTPSAVESIFVQEKVTSDHLRRGENPRYFGFIPLFASKPMTELRVSIGHDLEQFKQMVGVDPYAILSPSFSRKEGFAMTLSGENLISRVSSDKNLSLYLAVPIESIDQVLVNQRSVAFSEGSDKYGTLLAVERGTNEITVKPRRGRRNLIYSLYYGAYAIIFVLLFQPVKFLSKIFRETSFNLSDLLSRTMASNNSRT